MKLSLIMAASLATAATMFVVVACDSSGGEEDPRLGPSSDAGSQTADAADAAIADGSIREDAGVDAAPDPVVDASAAPIACAVAPCAVEIAAGAESVCVRLDDGTVRCWGSNANGELGRGTSEVEIISGAPAPVVGLSNVTQIAAAASDPGDTFCARRADGSVWCWGSNARGMLGRTEAEGGTEDGGAVVSTESSPTSAPVAQLSAASAVFVGHSVACAVLSTKSITCWGTNLAAQIPGVEPGALVAPTAIALPEGTAEIRDIAIADRGTVALAADGALYSWGLRGEALGPSTGVLGREVSLEYATPAPLALGLVSDIAASNGRVCANANGRVTCWGAGTTSGSDSVYPTPIGIGTGLAFAQSISVGPRAVCAALADRNAYCWGNNAKGQLGVGNTDLQPLPVAIANLGGQAVRLANMNGATCAILVTGAVQCWGENTKGQLGLGAADALGHLEPKTVELSP